MIRNLAVALLAFFFGLAPAWAGDEDTFPLLLAPGTPTTDLIYQIDSVSISLLKTNPPTPVIAASGKALTGGWSNPRLQPRIYIVPPVDGIWDIDFVMTPPPKGKITTEVLTPHKASLVWPNVPNFVRGFRVHGATNAVESLFTTAAPTAKSSGAPMTATAVKPDVRIEVKRPVIVNKQPATDPKPSLLEATLTISNPTKSDIRLVVPTPCQVIDWKILAADGSITQSEAPEICVTVLATLKLKPGQAVTSPLPIALDKAAYRSGDYKLMISFWGIQAEAMVNIQVVQ